MRRPLKTRTMETLVGFLVMLVAIFFVVFAYIKTDIHSSDGYILHAKFHNISGLRRGSDVRVGGVKVGSVVRMNIDAQTFAPTVTFTMPHGLRFSTDTQARIVSSSLIGDRFIDLVPGGAEDDLKHGDTIHQTQDALNFEDLISKALFQMSKK